MMDPVVDEFAALVAAGAAPRAADSVRVERDRHVDHRRARRTDPAYWGRHLRQPVRFADGRRRAARRLAHACCSKSVRAARWHAGPSSTGVRPDTASSSPRCRIRSSRRRQADRWPPRSAGCGSPASPVDWRGSTGGERRRRVPLPTYPFERQRYWVEPRPIVAATAARAVERARPRRLVPPPVVEARRRRRPRTRPTASAAALAGVCRRAGVAARSGRAPAAERPRRHRRRRRRRGSRLRTAPVDSRSIRPSGDYRALIAGAEDAQRRARRHRPLLGRDGD